MKNINKIFDCVTKSIDKIIKLRNKKTLKNDGSFVSEGDLLIQSIVFDEINRLYPNHELISEEMAPFINVKWNKSGSYVILDPIDGTENFVSGLKEWGVGISVFTNGKHEESGILLPELNEILVSGMKVKKYNSRIYGLSSSLSCTDLQSLKYENYEYRIIGCSMYNTLNAIKGSFAVFENFNGVNCWDILPGINLALENRCTTSVDGKSYKGEILFPTKKYTIKIISEL